jgi:hypothetical protein
MKELLLLSAGVLLVSQALQFPADGTVTGVCAGSGYRAA